MRRVDHRIDRLGLQIIAQAGNPAEPADADRHRLGFRLRHAPGIGERDAQIITRGERLRQRAGLPRAAEQEDIAGFSRSVFRRQSCLITCPTITLRIKRHRRIRASA